MLSRDLGLAIANTERILWVIWLALLSAIVTYVALAFFLGGQGEALVTADQLRILNLIFPVIAVAIVAAALLWHRVALSEASAARRMKPAEVRGGRGGTDGSGPGLSEIEQRLLSLAPRYLNVMIVTWALIEVVCLLGLVLVFLLREPLLILPYAGVSVVLMVITRPDLAGTLERLERVAR